MKKNATIEEKALACARYLLKDWKHNDRNGDIRITGRFREEYRKGGNQEMVFELGRNRISFGNLSEQDYAMVTNLIANAVMSSLKLKKNEVGKKIEKSYTTCGYYPKTYSLCSKVVVIKKCKSFININKKLVALGLKEICCDEWYYDRVSGKRSSIFYRDRSYYAENEKMCEKVLAYLRGKKKVSYEYFNDDDLEDMKRGIEYETEWDGYESHKLVFTDSKGKKTRIY